LITGGHLCLRECDARRKAGLKQPCLGRKKRCIGCSGVLSYYDILYCYRPVYLKTLLNLILDYVEENAGEYPVFIKNENNDYYLEHTKIMGYPHAA